MIVRNRFWILALIITASISFWQGSQLGAQQIMLANAAGQAMISARYARMLKQGKVDEVIPFLELDVDMNISNYGYFLEHDHSWVLWPYTGLISNETRDRAMSIAVKYRKEYPYTWPKTEEPSDKSLSDLMSENEKERKMYSAKMMEKYSPFPRAQPSTRTP